MDTDNFPDYVTICSDIELDSLEASSSSKTSSCQCFCCENSSLSCTSCSHSCNSETSDETQSSLSDSLEGSTKNEKKSFTEEMDNFSSLEPLQEFDNAFASYIEDENHLRKPFLVSEDDEDGLILFTDTEKSSEQSELTLGTSNSAMSPVSEDNSLQEPNSLEFDDIDGGLTSLKLVQQESPHSNMDFYYINDICSECQILSPGMYGNLNFN